MLEQFKDLLHSLKPEKSPEKKQARLIERARSIFDPDSGVVNLFDEDSNLIPLEEIFLDPAQASSLVGIYYELLETNLDLHQHIADKGLQTTVAIKTNKGYASMPQIVYAKPKPPIIIQTKLKFWPNCLELGQVSVNPQPQFERLEPASFDASCINELSFINGVERVHDAIGQGNYEVFTLSYEDFESGREADLIIKPAGFLANSLA
jgi:hypothetical protein